MSTRSSKSAIFIASLTSNPKGKYKKEVLKKKDIERRKPECPSLPTPMGFNPQIKFYPKTLIDKKERFDLQYYYQTLKIKYGELDIENKPDSDKIFDKTLINPRVKIEKLRKNILLTQAKIRVIEIEAFNRKQNK